VVSGGCSAEVPSGGAGLHMPDGGGVGKSREKNPGRPTRWGAKVGCCRKGTGREFLIGVAGVHDDEVDERGDPQRGTQDRNYPAWEGHYEPHLIVKVNELLKQERQKTFQGEPKRLDPTPILKGKKAKKLNFHTDLRGRRKRTKLNGTLVLPLRSREREIVSPNGVCG